MRALAVAALLFAASSLAAEPGFPFPDNLDPSACGIPTAWGKSDPAWLDGHYAGKLTEPEVRLWDSHARKRVVGRAKTGTKVRVKLFQPNPTLNYYLVATLEGPRLEGWVPAPYLRLKPR